MQPSRLGNTFIRLGISISWCITSCTTVLLFASESLVICTSNKLYNQPCRHSHVPCVHTIRRCQQMLNTRSKLCWTQQHRHLCWFCGRSFVLTAVHMHWTALTKETAGGGGSGSSAVLHGQWRLPWVMRYPTTCYGKSKFSSFSVYVVRPLSAPNQDFSLFSVLIAALLQEIFCRYL